MTSPIRSNPAGFGESGGNRELQSILSAGNCCLCSYLVKLGLTCIKAAFELDNRKLLDVLVQVLRMAPEIVVSLAAEEHQAREGAA